MRTIARETVFKIIFSTQFGGEADRGVRTALYRANKLTDEDVAYCERVLAVISEHSEQFGCLLDEHSASFPEKRIFPADKSIMFVALAEILYMDDIPDKVSLNEAANIASKYSSEKSASFITGVLSAICGGKNV